MAHPADKRLHGYTTEPGQPGDRRLYQQLQNAIQFSWNSCPEFRFKIIIIITIVAAL